MPSIACPIRTITECKDSTGRYVERQLDMSQVIIRDLEIMHGTPVFKGTRVPVQNLFDYLGGGETLESFLEGFPTMSRDCALQALEEAKELLLAAS